MSCDCDVYFAAYDPATSVELFAVRAPGPNVQPVGDACPTTMTFDATVPRLGQMLTLSGDHVPTGWFGVLLLDAQLRDPFPLIGGGCTGLVLPQIVVPKVLSGPSWSVNLGVPSDPGLDGVAIAWQAWFIDPGLASMGSTRALLVGLGF